MKTANPTFVYGGMPLWLSSGAETSIVDRPQEDEQEGVGELRRERELHR